MSQFNFETALNLVKSNDQFPINFDDAWQWLEFSTKGNAKKSFEKCGFIENIDYVVLILSDNSDNHAGLSPQEKAVLQNTKTIKLAVDCFKTWSMMVNTEKGKEVRRYFLECEKIAKNKVEGNDFILEKVLNILEKTTTKLDENEKAFKQAMQMVSVVEEEKFEKDYYIKQIDEITKEHPLFRALLQFVMVIKMDDYSFPKVNYSIKQILDIFPINTISKRDFVLMSSGLYYLNNNKKPDKQNIYKYSGEDLIYPSLILFKQENYDWKEIKTRFEIDYKLRFPNSNRKYLIHN